MIITKESRLFDQFAPLAICKLADKLGCKEPSIASWADEKSLWVPGLVTVTSIAFPKAWAINQLLEWLVKEKGMLVHIPFMSFQKHCFVGLVYMKVKGKWVTNSPIIHQSSVQRTVVLKTLTWILKKLNDVEAKASKSTPATEEQMYIRKGNMLYIRHQFKGMGYATKKPLKKKDWPKKSKSISIRKAPAGNLEVLYVNEWVRVTYGTKEIRTYMENQVWPRIPSHYKVQFTKGVGGRIVGKIVDKNV